MSKKRKHDWSWLEAKAERELARNKALIEETARGTASQKPSTQGKRKEDNRY